MLTNGIGRSNFFVFFWFWIDGFCVVGMYACMYVYGAGYCWMDYGWMDGWMDPSELTDGYMYV